MPLPISSGGPYLSVITVTYTGYTYIFSFLLNWALYGALCAQVYLYYLAFPEDRPLNKVLVYSVFMMETVQTMLLLQIGIFVYDFPSIHILPTIWPDDVTLWTAIPLLGGIVEFVVQTFYAYRLHILAHSQTITILVVLLALVQFVLGIRNGGSINGPTSNGPIPNGPTLTTRIVFPGFSLLSIIWGFFSIACDLVIAIAMTYFLLRKDTGWKPTHTLLVKLVRLAVETGTITMLIAAAYLMIGFSPIRAMMPPLAIILGKVYSNAMMVNFNHRLQISGGRNEAQIGGFTMPSSLSAIPS
ncbi:hypothetical protein L208DRAFT_1384270 [Tricholoma matsutake]|nr:hypothetical protein L208DRAFT_1384270 [Tricholoma matsutake 945]